MINKNLQPVQEILTVNHRLEIFAPFTGNFLSSSNKFSAKVAEMLEVIYHLKKHCIIGKSFNSNLRKAVRIVASKRGITESTVRSTFTAKCGYNDITPWVKPVSRFILNGNFKELRELLESHVSKLYYKGDMEIIANFFSRYYWNKDIMLY